MYEREKLIEYSLRPQAAYMDLAGSDPANIEQAVLDEHCTNRYSPRWRQAMAAAMLLPSASDVAEYVGHRAWAKEHLYDMGERLDYNEPEPADLTLMAAGAIPNLNSLSPEYVCKPELVEPIHEYAQTKLIKYIVGAYNIQPMPGWQLEQLKRSSGAIAAGELVALAERNNSTSETALERHYQFFINCVQATEGTVMLPGPARRLYISLTKDRQRVTALTPDDEYIETIMHPPRHPENYTNYNLPADVVLCRWSALSSLALAGHAESKRLIPYVRNTVAARVEPQLDDIAFRIEKGQANIAELQCMLDLVMRHSKYPLPLKHEGDRIRPALMHLAKRHESAVRPIGHARSFYIPVTLEGDVANQLPLAAKAFYPGDNAQTIMKRIVAARGHQLGRERRHSRNPVGPIS